MERGDLTRPPVEDTAGVLRARTFNPRHARAGQRPPTATVFDSGGRFAAGAVAGRVA